MRAEGEGEGEEEGEGGEESSSTLKGNLENWVGPFAFQPLPSPPEKHQTSLSGFSTELMIASKAIL